jgi:hypothetical protein
MHCQNMEYSDTNLRQNYHWLGFDYGSFHQGGRSQDKDFEVMLRLRSTSKSQLASFLSMR